MPWPRHGEWLELMLGHRGPLVLPATDQEQSDGPRWRWWQHRPGPAWQWGMPGLAWLMATISWLCFQLWESAHGEAGPEGGLLPHLGTDDDHDQCRVTAFLLQAAAAICGGVLGPGPAHPGPPGVVPIAAQEVKARGLPWFSAMPGGSSVLPEGLPASWMRCWVTAWPAE